MFHISQVWIRIFQNLWLKIEYRNNKSVLRKFSHWTFGLFFWLILWFSIILYILLLQADTEVPPLSPKVLSGFLIENHINFMNV